MAKEKINPFAFEKYEPAYVANQYVQAGDLTRAGIALRATPVDDDGRLLLNEDPHYKTDEGIASGSKIYGNQFNRGLVGLTFDQLKDFYMVALSSASNVSDDTRKRAEAIFAKYAGKKVGDVEEAYLDAARILKDPETYKKNISKHVAKEKLDEVV